jgi:hypothetical protein
MSADTSLEQHWTEGRAASRRCYTGLRDNYHAYQPLRPNSQQWLICLSHSERATNKRDTDNKSNLHDQMNKWRHNALFPKDDKENSDVSFPVLIRPSWEFRSSLIHMGFVCGITWFSDWNSGFFCLLTHDNPGAVALPIQSIFFTCESITIIIILYQYGTEHTQFFWRIKNSQNVTTHRYHLYSNGPFFIRSQDRPVGIVTGWTAGVRLQEGERFILSSP